MYVVGILKCGGGGNKQLTENLFYFGMNVGGMRNGVNNAVIFL